MDSQLDGLAGELRESGSKFTEPRKVGQEWRAVLSVLVIAESLFRYRSSACVPSTRGRSSGNEWSDVVAVLQDPGKRVVAGERVSRIVLWEDVGL
eukprot:6208700-Pleurochrysis_carterae.AAC.1